MPKQDAACWPVALAAAGQLGMITVWVGVPKQLSSLADAGLHLVVEADPTRAQRCRTACPGNPALVVCDQVLAPQSDASVPWCLFNDYRLNGPLDLQAWLARYPNLRQIGEEQRLGFRVRIGQGAQDHEIPAGGTVLEAHIRLAIGKAAPLQPDRPCAQGALKRACEERLSRKGAEGNVHPTSLRLRTRRWCESGTT